jgi:hypothetical protein
VGGTVSLDGPHSRSANLCVSGDAGGTGYTGKNRWSRVLIIPTSHACDGIQCIEACEREPPPEVPAGVMASKKEPKRTYVYR